MFKQIHTFTYKGFVNCTLFLHVFFLSFFYFFNIVMIYIFIKISFTLHLFSVYTKIITIFFISNILISFKKWFEPGVPVYKQFYKQLNFFYLKVLSITIKAWTKKIHIHIVRYYWCFIEFHSQIYVFPFLLFVLKNSCSFLLNSSK